MKNPSFEEYKEIILSQARKIQAFKGTETYEIVFNTFMALKKASADERKKIMKAQTTRENCLYLTGFEDGIQQCLDGLDKIVSDGEEIIAAKEAQGEM